MTRIRTLLAVALVGLFANAASADLIGIDQPDFGPDLNLSGQTSYSYDASTDTFTIEAAPTQYTPDLGNPGTTYVAQNVGGAAGTQTILTAEINELGELVGGTLVVTGRLINTSPPPGPVVAEGTLLTANLVQFGYLKDGANVQFDFLAELAAVDSENGLLNSDFNLSDGLIGLLLNSQSDAASSFNESFTASFNGGTASTTVDIFVPQPTTIPLLLGGAMAGLTGLRRRLGSRA